MHFEQQFIINIKIQIIVASFSSRLCNQSKPLDEKAETSFPIGLGRESTRLSKHDILNLALIRDILAASSFLWNFSLTRFCE